MLDVEIYSTTKLRINEFIVRVLNIFNVIKLPLSPMNDLSLCFFSLYHSNWMSEDVVEIVHSRLPCCLVRVGYSFETKQN